MENEAVHCAIHCVRQRAENDKDGRTCVQDLTLSSGIQTPMSGGCAPPSDCAASFLLRNKSASLMLQCDKKSCASELGLMSCTQSNKDSTAARCASSFFFSFCNSTSSKLFVASKRRSSAASTSLTPRWNASCCLAARDSTPLIAASCAMVANQGSKSGLQDNCADTSESFEPPRLDATSRAFSYFE